MKVRSILLSAVFLFTAGCSPSFNSQDEVVEENPDESGQETAIIPSYSITDENYRVLLEYKPSQARGVIINQVANRVDIDELEEGLRRHSKTVFNTEEYFFEEGQYLTEDLLLSWLGRAESDMGEEGDTEEENEEDVGLNPEISVNEEQLEELEPDEAEELLKEMERENPRYLSHILEQNYLTKTEDGTVGLGGMSLGIALKSTYRFQTEIGGPYYYEEIPESEMLTEGKRIAEEVVNRIRGMEDVPDIPIMIALYREEDRSSLVPGNFAAKTLVEEGQNSPGDWEEINEEYILFPSAEAEEKYPNDSEDMKNLETEIAEYFPNYVGVVGEGFYINGQLSSLTVEVPIEFRGKAEVIGFTQYVYGLVVETLPDYYDLEINITANDQQESLLIKKSGEKEPIVHIYH